ncbi:hypothetical protein BUALT_Bualt06G0023700 [Buddleja alternifolia]|uniref:Lysine-specific demethylase ELF6 n=1 Tax=Buddleja alternifolia TaxID=168488 RepID=A0AAV6XMW0_9LAMI|nr:hypothetical protein BUALT_Bualt06G0023700 [Buddleja alternifolia]
MKNVDVPKWLEGLPLAPEFRPTDTEFADPIAYISKIEKEASVYGICKVIPPLPKPSRKYVLQNLNKSLSKCPELGSDVNLVGSSRTDSPRDNCDRSVNGGESRAVFTTRHQELGCDKGKKVKTAVRNHGLGAQKQVWQSGEVYTLEQFEAKSKNFAKSQLGTLKDVNPSVIEAMFWKAASDKPVYIEYANDVPGSGFGEPDGLFHYFHRSRRRRTRKRNSYDRNNLDSSDNKNDQVDTVNKIRADKNSDSQNNLNLCTETASNSLPSVESHLGGSVSGQKDSRPSSEMEGTAGWKLSNCPWNLQVIARSPGSLTRFMPDDIPGVTSPMVYIGMLFSWFAWHVEDHELHSLNFLHIGSPKTWYAVPGDYAFNFEEVIRLHAYGGNTDRLVALSLLGEKTTVLSPEVIVASGIPCYRLVQNPGEFVVTFPRAYHIGFSHGFNCGEAANFGTPKWLSVAKEAAVRRAAMNYLPMLSHQQLLYLLTMSFISRIPRSLLPGVRSSRLRDRQKEERELLVKKAFIEDILHENNLLAILLQRNSSHHAVLWDMESLPSSNKEPEIRKDVDASTLKSTEKGYPENGNSLDNESQLSKYISAVGFDLNDDDLAYDFQMDSGTLPCVACGILGFPFMAVVQPSEVALKNLVVEENLTFPVESCVPSDLDHVVEGSTEENKDKLNGKCISHLTEASSVAESSRSTCSQPMEQLQVPDHSSSFKYETVSSKVEIEKEWNISNVFLKPRIFCLEHAIEIEELLRSKGGANVLVICHSDFQKIKTHAAVVAEEIGTPFHYNEIPLCNASQEGLNLIDIAIDSEKPVTFIEDWTSQLNINLQYCVKVKKSYPSKNLQYLLNLSGLFYGVTPVSNSSGVKWVSRKLRSKRHLKYPLQGKPSDGIETVKKTLKNNLESEMAKEVKIIQYSRKKYKSSSSAPRIENGELQSRTWPSKEPTADGKTGLSYHDSQANGCIEKNESNISENPADSPPSDENRRENETLTEERAKSSSIEGQQHFQTEGNNPEKAVSNDTALINESTTSALVEQLHVPSDTIEKVGSHNDNDKTASAPKKSELDDMKSPMSKPKLIAKIGNKRKRDMPSQTQDDSSHVDGFIKSPCEGLRPRARKDALVPSEEILSLDKPRKPMGRPVTRKDKKQKQRQKGVYKCDLDGCTMSFHTKGELVLHKGNRCPVEGCRKKFNSHKYAIQHQRVHDDDRPLKCTWNGCTMSFKWAWARTEHLRVHTGERPYSCKVEGCGLTFRFVSDFSRHRRKTGHYVNAPK